MPAYQLAQLNIARLCAPIDSPQLANFVANLDRINALADQSPGFVWRLQTDEGDATGIDHFGADHIVNMSVWQTLEHLHDYVYRSAHVEVMRRKKEWFHKLSEAHMVLWWVPAGHRPSLDEAEAKLQAYRANGPTAGAFSFKKPFCAPDETAKRVIEDLGGTCPAV